MRRGAASSCFLGPRIGGGRIRTSASLVPAFRPVRTRDALDWKGLTMEDRSMPTATYAASPAGPITEILVVLDLYVARVYSLVQ
jgi:hypothetical protein